MKCFKRKILIPNVLHDRQKYIINWFLYQTQDHHSFLNNEFRQDFIINNQVSWPHFKNFTETMMSLDTVTYLPDDILVKVDRASMASSLETRIPFLDTRLIEYVWKLPISFKVSGKTGKLILRNLLSEYLPSNLFERPKQGFGIPLNAWIRGDLRDWAQGLISDIDKDNPVICKAKFLNEWEGFLAGNNMHASIWAVLMYQQWKTEWR